MRVANPLIDFMRLEENNDKCPTKERKAQQADD